LRPFAETDVDRVYEACQDEDIGRFTATLPSPYARADAMGWIAAHDGLRRDGSGLELAIELDQVGLAGAIGLTTSTGTPHRPGRLLGRAVGAWTRRRDPPAASDLGVRAGSTRPALDHAGDGARERCLAASRRPGRLCLRRNRGRRPREVPGGQPLPPSL